MALHIFKPTRPARLIVSSTPPPPPSCRSWSILHTARVLCTTLIMATKDDSDGDGETDRGDADSDCGGGPGGNALHPRLRELLQEDSEYEGEEEDRAVMTAAVHALPLEAHLHALRWLTEDNFHTADVDASKSGCWALEVIAP